jgi:hypothetical protein
MSKCVFSWSTLIGKQKLSISEAFDIYIMSCFRTEQEEIQELAKKIDPTSSYLAHFHEFLQYVYAFQIVKDFIGCVEFLAQTIYQYNYFVLLVVLTLIIFKAKLFKEFRKKFTLIKTKNNNNPNSVPLEVGHISKFEEAEQELNQITTDHNEEKSFQDVQKLRFNKLMKNAALFEIIGNNPHIFDEVYKHYELFLVKSVQNVLRRNEVAGTLKQIIQSCIDNQSKRVQTPQQGRKEGILRTQSHPVKPLLLESRTMDQRVVSLSDDYSDEHLLGLSL